MSNPKRSGKPSTATGSPAELAVVFSSFAVAGLIAAAFAPIQDCDEVFNYWEPTHFLNHGYGLQTWEYSPEYGIRSWAYAALHAGLISLGRQVPFMNSKISEFYFVRSFLAFICATCQTRLYFAISKSISQRVAIIFALIMVINAGMYHASIAYLPSTFAMYTTMLGSAAFMDNLDGAGTAEGIFWFGLGSLLGWPFAAALAIPFLFVEIIRLISSDDKGMRFLHFVDGGVRCVGVLVLQVLVDSVAFDKPALVPWNIVAYNVFGGDDRGPNIYGTEPWHFYLRNLALNFNVWLLLALVSKFIVLAQAWIMRKPVLPLFSGPTLTVNLVADLWLCIFTWQPHKEERFLYPIYPLLALNAAVTFHILLVICGSRNRKTLAGKVPAFMKLFGVVSFIAVCVVLGLGRAAGIFTAYSAPLQVYAPLEHIASVQPEATLCLGKEWYRFPSSYFLPDGYRAKFIRSSFDGLLPGQFDEWRDVPGLLRAVSAIPPGMNDRNIVDPSKYVQVEQCDFLVDSYFPETEPSPLEPNYMKDTAAWESLKCAPFLDTGKTGALGRMFWVPDWSFVPPQFQRKWGNYCLLRKRDIWVPSSFKRPAAAPYQDWSLEDTKPLPYRPIRHQYFVTMGLRSMQWDEWIELDNHYMTYHDRKAERMKERGDKCCRTAPEAFDGAVELVEEFCDYLPQRYPNLYRKTEVGMDNLVTGETFNIVERPLAEDPMQMAGRMVQDDLAIMMERPDGQYYLVAGAILLAGFWRLEDKFGMPLSEIHTSGEVPQYKEKLEKGMMNFFKRLRPETPMLRNNYFIQVDDDVAFSHTLGSENSYPFDLSWASAPKNRPVDTYHFRSERQSLRRLPRSGAVVFTIRTYFHPITDICKEKYVPGRLASGIRSWAPDVSKYRGRAQFEEVLLPYLDGEHQKQLDDGLDLGNEDEHHSYPY
ncbi:hypothetical protein P152DRAFT_504931 [Eremomyces bilateralis CBS 781.70]|uniref:Mannosyltransferase n=1 Tax=Eremomyces bilateralis CBS 781.70 TaxID=1392243 RepID=A0A6G1GDT5_9PEZI|nr:uncharacterized protein P152DRAFT_504931 [Eremomyces bilateralis CBS 781.70]KAF1816203.1 hypothetical protein P152DRAFT_504931 [Eremomyces bilateralis CBS 781.70]